MALYSTCPLNWFQLHPHHARTYLIIPFTSHRRRSKVRGIFFFRAARRNHADNNCCQLRSLAQVIGPFRSGSLVVARLVTGRVRPARLSCPTTDGSPACSSLRKIDFRCGLLAPPPTGTACPEWVGDLAGPTGLWPQVSGWSCLLRPGLASKGPEPAMHFHFRTTGTNQAISTHSLRRNSRRR